MRVYADSEFGALNVVLLASVGGFRLHPPINKTQEHFYRSDPPRLDILVHQQEEFAKVLKAHGVEIIWAPTRNDSPNQVNVRDVASVVSDRFLICSMKWSVRQNEHQSIGEVASELGGPVLRVDTGVVEGGDLMLAGDTLYVGLSERTDRRGLEWLKRRFGDRFEIVALRLNPPFIHLDMVFNVIGDETALIYPPGVEGSSLRLIEERYDLVEVDAEEQFTLATNVLSLSPDTIVSDKRHRRLNDVLRKAGRSVIELEYSELTKIGGSFRCSTCPLVRQPAPKKRG